MELIGTIWIWVLGGLVAVAFMSLASRGHEPDPEGDRARSLYLHVVMFVSLLAGIWTLVALAGAIVTAVFGTELVESSSDMPGGDRFVVSQIVVGLVVLVVLGLVFRAHRDRGREFSAEPGYAASPGGRVALTYFFLGCFAVIAIGVASVSSAVISLLTAWWPPIDYARVGAAGGRDALIGRGAVGIVVALLMWAIFRAYWSAAERGRTPVATPAAGEPPVNR